MAFIPYANPTRAASTIAPAQYQFNSIAPFQNNSSGINAAANTPHYQLAASNTAAGLGGDPGTYSSGGRGGSGGGGGGAAPAPDLSSYDQSIGNINAGISRLDPQASVGHQNILDSYNTAYNTLLDQKAQAQQKYNQNKATEGQTYVGNKNTINSGVGSAINSAQRLLGSKGAGSSSAALFNAPAAAARQGNLQRNQAGQTFSKNNQTLDQNWGDFGNNWNNSANDLGHQRDVQNNTLDASIASNRASLLQQLAGLKTQRGAAAGMTTAQAVAAGQPYINQANGLLSQADQLGQQYAHPVLQATPVTYTAPTLDTYTAVEHNPVSLGTGNTNALTDTVFPYINTLLGKDKTPSIVGA